MPRHTSSIPDNSSYGKPESLSDIMARIAAAPIRNEVIECDAVSAYPPEMTRRRHSSSIPDTATKRRNISHSDSPVPMLVSNRRTDDYLCSSLPYHTHPTPLWLIHPEDFRCDNCRRYCSDAFLAMVNGQQLCGYCRGQF
jgi:hypothetical protein